MKNVVQRLLSRKAGSHCVLIGLALVISGCGGGAMSQADMMRMSRRRIKKDDADPPTKVATATTTPPSAPDAAASTHHSTKPPDHNGVPTTAVQHSAVQTTPAPVKQQRPAIAADLSDTQQPPARPHSFQERSRRSGTNLERIAQALEAYADEHGKYPQQAIYAQSRSTITTASIGLL